MAHSEETDIFKSAEDVMAKSAEDPIPFAVTAKNLSGSFEEGLEVTQASTPIPLALSTTAVDHEPDEWRPQEAPTQSKAEDKDKKVEKEEKDEKEDKEEKEEKEEFTSRPFKEDSKGFRRGRTTFDEPLESAQYRDQKRRLAQEQLKEEKRQNRRRIIRMVVCTIFTLEMLIFSGYFIFLLLLSGIIFSTEVMPWTYSPLSATFEFKKFAASSNSESCNEEARSLYIEGHSLYGIAFAMVICLMKHAPHRGGLGGASVAVFVDAKKSSCMQTQGYPRFPIEINKAKEKNKGDADFEMSTVLWPGEHDTLMAFAQKIKRNEWQRLIHKLLSDRARKFAVDADLARHLRIMDTMLNIVLNYDFLFEHCSHGLQEGDIGEMPKNFVGDQSWIQETFKYETLFSELGQRFNATVRNAKPKHWISATLLQSSTGKICLPEPPGTSSIIEAALEEITKEPEMESVSEAKKTAYLYKRAHGIIGSIIEKAKIHLAVPPSSDLPKKEQRSIPTTPYAANFFTLVDVKKNQAIAYTSTIGTSFGSLINSKSQPSIILNNLYDSIGTMNAFFFLPIIAFDKKIKFAWTGPGGFLQKSLDVPRLITSLVFHFYNETLLHFATTTPLIFPSPLNFSEYSSGFQWETLNELRSHVASYWKTLRGEPARPMAPRGTRYSRIDTGAVVEAHGKGYTPFYFNDNEDRIMPSGV
ncbi:hypothetical protein Aduo_007534 [Ancylostoma duodenale]